MKATALLMVFTLSSLVSCFAPKAKPVGGPIEQQLTAALESGSERFDHSPWDELLAAGTVDGFVDYGYMAERRADLDAYLDAIADADLSALDADHLEALLINAYNAITVRSILDQPGVTSIRADRRRLEGRDAPGRRLRPHPRPDRAQPAYARTGRTHASTSW